MADETAALLDELGAVLGSAGLLSGGDIPERSLTDWMGGPPAAPLAVARPADADQVSAALRICHAHGVPVTPQGGMTGLCGGARPADGGVALSLERMTAIERVDPDGMTMTVQAGATLEAVQQAAEAAGLYFALDLGARGGCTIGGNLATNAGGNRVIRYGMTRDLTLGLEAVLPDGTRVDMLNTMVKNNAGYDLKQLFIGAEGTLGVITRAVLRLHPKPACQAVALCVVDSYEAVLRVLGAARARLGPLLSAFEVMWRDYWEKVTADVPGLRAPLEIGGGSHVILIEMQGADADRDSGLFEEFLGALLEEGVVTDGAVSQSEADIADFWRLRDVAGELVRPHILGPHVAFDIGLPVREMEAFTEDAKAALGAELGAKSLHYGHIGDGNMHVIAWVPGAALPYGAISRIVYDRVRALGGTVSAEHGIGLLKKPYLAHTRSEAEIALMRRIKACLDPGATLNPSKIFD